ncbi:CRISPR-associated endonuclease Csn1 [Enterococcus sp. PF1-24]|uniref:type II CRISPR RNA-guided endonuclease Cas9 n=1 Tax=unclassified Enterococcus TaxID=2608891 RepID=UPI002473552A|nr:MULTISPECIES: type II CRISPR RNA-guided endonuclease Cas9 [unclassified Enterococcus]MDH6365209.1 CRISPR-associated endonuclease Csn1 [Enterococcus sp. PFB1-1]MDH6402310.1 CRISPR-associated endonuclease Csn1 [Enterococcus sp. PF1-24]
MNKNYTVGLDIGTASVGWAVIDDQFNLIQGKKRINDNGKLRKVKTNLWGVRLFEAGDVAADRRLKRGQRRRLKRRHERLNYLRGIFAEEMFKVDDSFFIRLDESFYQMEDKKADTYQYRDSKGYLQSQSVVNKPIVKYPLFKTKSAEKDYYKKYPTIYHLRKHLMESNVQADLREIYLAMHHIVKYRGHFTNQGQKFDLRNMDIAGSLAETLSIFEEATSFTFGIANVDTTKANEILENNRLSKSKKAFDLNEVYKVAENSVYMAGNEQFVEIFEEKTVKQKADFIKDKQKQIKALFTAIVGNKINLKDIFANSQYTEKENELFPKDLYFNKEDFEDNLATLENLIQPEELEVLISGKKVYESIILAGILNGKSSLSAAMVEKYENHKNQLSKLKKFTLSISKELYDSFFKENGIYSQYIQGTGDPAKTTNLEDFYKAIKKSFEKEFKVKFPDGEKTFDFSQVDLSDETQKFLNEISNEMKFETYLLKQRMYKNGAIPYQIHEEELLTIINNQKQYYPFLGETIVLSEEDDEGNIVKKTEYKIQTLMKFRIPYYVGPLTEAKQGTAGKKQSSKSRFAWMQKITDEKVTPWNFDKIVNKETSAVEFIERMTSFCTYLPDEKVLPKNSLTYQEFCVYNELIVSGYYEKDYTGKSRKTYFGVGLMSELVENLFKKHKKVTANQVLDFLCNQKNIRATDIFGIDRRTLNGKPSFNNSLATYIDLINAGIPAEMIEKNRQELEEIIKWQTIFEDKKVLKKTIRNANQKWQIFSDTQVKNLAGRRYSGFGNLSMKLIDGIRDKQTGLTILEQLKANGYDNFMRLVFGETANRYTYKKQIEALQTQNIDETTISYEAVENLAGSPAIKKGIWQSLEIIQELEDFLGRENIGKVVIEMSRENALGRTQSRYNKLKKLYDSFKENNKELIEEVNKEQIEKVNKELESYKKREQDLNTEKLYLYFNQLGKCAYTDTELHINELANYEVDHIIPQSFIKDDSIANKVLVTKYANQKKGGNVPSQNIINDRISFWEILVKANLMSQKKYKSLTMGKMPDKLEGFINRQLVENRQITKNVANILAKYYENTDTVILTPKSALTSQFRKGIIYLPNPDFDENKAKADPKNYQVKRLKKEVLHPGFPKNRDINDYHHAHDAYLNAVVANYLYLTKPELKNVWVYGSYERKAADTFGKWANQRKNKSLQLLSDMLDENWVDKETGEILGKRDEILTKIGKILSYRNVNLVKKIETQIGKFGDESVYKKDPKAKSFANGLKDDLNPNNYGGTKAPISAFTAVIKNSKGNIKPISIPAMVADKYLAAENKLNFVQELYPKDKVVEVVVEKVPKYTKFENNNVLRLLASTVEAQKADALSFTQKEMSLLKQEDSILIPLYDKVSNYLVRNKVYSDVNLNKWQTGIREEFITLIWKEQAEFIMDAFSITKSGTTTANGMIKGKIGGPNGRQRHTSKAIDTITNNTTLIYQSITGLYETRRTLK